MIIMIGIFIIVITITIIIVTIIDDTAPEMTFRKMWLYFSLNNKYNKYFFEQLIQ